MKTRYIIAPIVMLAILVAFSTPAMANYAFDGFDVTTRTSGSINGTVYTFSKAYTGATTLTLENCNISSGTVKAAYLYTGIWCGSDTNIHWSNVSFNKNYTANGLGPINISGIHDTGNDNNVWCSGYGKSWWWYNVTNLTTNGPGTTNNATVAKINGSDGNVYGIVLVVVLENSSLHPIQYWVNDRSYCLHYATGGHPATNTHTTDFDGSVDTGTVTFAELTVVHLTGYDPACEECLKFNNHLLNTECVDSNDFEINTWNVTSYVESSENDAWFTRCNDHPTCSQGESDNFVNICNVILTLNDTANDLIVEDVDVGTPRPNNDSTVNATVKNDGSDSVEHFNVSLYVDNVLNGTVNVTAGLGAGASTTVSFTKVNESKDCYDFKVFVDSHGNVSEDIETNNNKTVKGEVGYVIEVNSYHDFNDLVTESDDGLLGAGNVSHSGDTYYIKNFTGSSAIKNCACNGITIKNLNTSTKFVINNCTIENCTHSGVHLLNLSNGTIKNSTVQNNTEYGIYVGSDSKFVNITNNTLDKNNYGMLLWKIGTANSTVKNNTITNSTKYGIYIYGNYTNITNNTIQNNSDYGLKSYKGYHNYIYCNSFIDNNVDYPARTSQAWDNRNSNHWNSTELSKNYVGNRWKDWDDNSGFPCNYTIDGGSNVDKRPKGLYDFLTDASEDKWAFGRIIQSLPTNANDPNEEFDSTGYTKISQDDGDYKYHYSVTNGWYGAHRFNFSITEDPNDIDKINVTWKGRGRNYNYSGASNGSTLYIYNFTDKNYTELGNTTSRDWVYLTGEKTASTSNYISSSNNVTVLVNQTSPSNGTKRSTIWTDYVKLAVTIDP